MTLTHSLTEATEATMARTEHIEGYPVTLEETWGPGRGWKWTAPAEIIDGIQYVYCDPYKYDTVEDAIAAAERHLWAKRRLEGVPHELSREEYERRCADAGVEARTDEEIAHDSYAMKYFDFWQDQYTREQIVAAELARARFRAIEAGRQSAPVAVATEVDDPILATVGRVIDGKVWKPDAAPAQSGARCARCGTTSGVAWISGAGAHLCHRHQDDYS